jgi:hypothetical protein
LGSSVFTSRLFDLVAICIRLAIWTFHSLSIRFSGKAGVSFLFYSCLIPLFVVGRWLGLLTRSSLPTILKVHVLHSTIVYIISLRHISWSCTL